jgi:hypothetical protein
MQLESWTQGGVGELIHYGGELAKQSNGLNDLREHDKILITVSYVQAFSSSEIIA